MVVVAFVLAFICCGIKELMGYPLSSSILLICSVWSFSFACVQIFETFVLILPMCQEHFLGELQNAGETEDALRKGKYWFAQRCKRFKRIANMIMCISLSFGLCWIFLECSYENDALANGLTLLSIAFFFLGIAIKDFAEHRISTYTLKNENKT